VDTDAMIAAHREQWDRLGRLTRQRHLDAQEIDELIDLYQTTATHLSVVRSTNPDPGLTARLSVLLQRARLTITGARTPLWRHVRMFLWEDLPSALYQSRWTVALCGAITLALALATGLFLGLDDAARTLLIPESAQRELVQHEFVGYYFQGQATGFAANVWTNNAWIAVQAVVLGVTGAWPVWMLIQNGVNIGVSAGVLAAHGELGTFFVYILPHGLLEITAICIGAGAGLRLFRSWVRPGPVPRSWALASAARSMITVAIGLVEVLFVSGLLEAFVTPSGLPAPLRLGIGVACWALLLVYMLVRGRAAHRAGITGDLDEDTVGARVEVAA
jgi:uncharacterized membrane protein SpoIIM required for sporulation